MTPEDLANSSNKIIQECEFTNMLQSMVDYGNSNVLTSFKYRLEMEPNHAGAIGDKGLIKALNCEYKEGIELFDRALKIDLNNSGILNNRKLVLEKSGDLENIAKL